MRPKILLLAAASIPAIAVWQPAHSQNLVRDDSAPILLAQQEQGKDKDKGKGKNQNQQQRQEQRGQRQDQRQEQRGQRQEQRQEQRGQRQDLRQEQKQDRQQQRTQQQQQRQDLRQQQQQSQDPNARQRREQRQDLRQQQGQDRRDQRQDQKQERRDLGQEQRQQQDQLRRQQQERTQQQKQRIEQQQGQQEKQRREQQQREDAQKQQLRQGQRQQGREERREDRQQGRQERREERQEGRQERREDRQEGRQERREERREADRARRIEELRSERHERREGNRTIIQEGNRAIVRDGNRTFIRHDESDRFRRFGRDVNVQRFGNETRTVVVGPGGQRIVTVTDGSGRLLRRSRYVNGREVVIIDNRPRGGRAATALFVALPALAVASLAIPRERYIVEAETAPPEYIYGALMAPPVEPLPRAYTLDEIRYSPDVRARMPRIDLNAITFDLGSWEITPDQYDRLAPIADGIKRAIAQNPNEVFLIEGHTDATGNDDDNLSLSDRRAEAVSVILTDQFQIPPENLTTQGYGSQQLKVPTPGPERANRRVTVRRITPLLQQGQAQSEGAAPPQ